MEYKHPVSAITQRLGCIKRSPRALQILFTHHKIEYPRIGTAISDALPGIIGCSCNNQAYCMWELSTTTSWNAPLSLPQLDDAIHSWIIWSVVFILWAIIYFYLFPNHACKKSRLKFLLWITLNTWKGRSSEISIHERWQYFSHIVAGKWLKQKNCALPHDPNFRK